MLTLLLFPVSILAGQVPSLMGYSNKFNTRAPTYEVIVSRSTSRSS
jgi:hypothetical protein